MQIDPASVEWDGPAVAAVIQGKVTLNDVQSKCVQCGGHKCGGHMLQSGQTFEQLAVEGEAQLDSIKPDYDYLNAVLRREAGAAISNAEFDPRKQYFPQPGDSAKVSDRSTGHDD